MAYMVKSAKCNSKAPFPVVRCNTASQCEFFSNLVRTGYQCFQEYLEQRKHTVPRCRVIILIIIISALSLIGSMTFVKHNWFNDLLTMQWKSGE